jgi:hypothetical protein
MSDLLINAHNQSAGTKMMECDGCHYRQIAQEHGHGHEH